jgi:hypothetical protein
VEDVGKTRELVVFRADGKAGKRLRAWDRRGGHLIERVVHEERTPSAKDTSIVSFVAPPAA